MENPLYTHTMNKKVNSEISLTLQGELQLKQWIKSTLQEVFGSFPLNDEKVRLLKGVTINIGFSPQLKVIYYEYRVEKEVFDRFIKHEEDFFHLGKAFLAEDMNRYFKILYPDLYHYCAYSFPLGTVYKIWCLQ